MLKTIAHPSDLSEEGNFAFEHALRLALEHRARLVLLHVHGGDERNQFDRFPHVREVLQRWGRLSEGASVADIAAETGVHVEKVEIRDVDAVEGVSHFMAEHKPDLVVMASHGRGGISRWLKGSISGEIARDSDAPALIIGPRAQPFVNPGNGELFLNRVLVAVDRDPPPGTALAQLRAVLGDLNPDLVAIHVGDDPPEAEGLSVRQVDGPVVEAIVEHAQRCDLIAMPTAGRKGLLDILRGSTTEQVLHQAPRPVLALPVRG